MKPEAKPIWEHDCKQCIYLGSLAFAHDGEEEDTAQDFYLHTYPIQCVDGTNRMGHVFMRRFGRQVYDCAVCLRGPYFQLVFHMALCMNMLRVKHEPTNEDCECNTSCYHVTDYSSCLVCHQQVSLVLTEKTISMIS